MERSRWTSHAAVTLGLVALAATGCARTGFDRSANIADTMSKQVTGLQEAKPQVDAMLASLEGLTRAEGDMRPAFKKFSETLGDTEKAAARARKSSQTLREKEAEYFAEWQRQAAEITNPQIKAATQARQAEVKRNLETLSQTGRTAGEAYEPFISNMKDIRTYLSNDLTAPRGQAPGADHREGTPGRRRSPEGARRLQSGEPASPDDVEAHGHPVVA